MTDAPSSTAAPARAEPILAKDNEIPLPPPEMWADLDNSRSKGNEPKEPKKVPPLMAVLEFIGEKKPFVEIPLTYPFRWDGRDITTIVVRRLTVQQIGDYVDDLGDAADLDRMAIYGLMTGLPAAVLRSLPDPDGTEVTNCCFNFLPRMFGGGVA